MNTATIITALQIAKAFDTDTDIDIDVGQPPIGESPSTGELMDQIKGENVLIRTVTMIYTGRVVSVDRSTIVIDDAAWIADTGRFADALATGNLSEVEPYPGQVFVARSAVVDVSVWLHALPRDQQ